MVRLAEDERRFEAAVIAQVEAMESAVCAAEVALEQGARRATVASSRLARADKDAAISRLQAEHTRQQLTMRCGTG